MKRVIHPQRLFLLDAAGALCTAFMLGFVLIRFEEYIRLPSDILVNLAAIAGSYAVYSFVNGLLFAQHSFWRLAMRFLAVLNFGYCCVTSGIILYYCKMMTPLGIGYFLLEILVILVLVVMEWRAAALYDK
ncbi:hypothetical protein ACFSTE_00610 [Aquimarina hainanensis]|uniref:Uncharacterized protein n=1 Tax=Aquimarina hainanensis TaxID=1578017 RepID=A0ABW5N100_9FLAO